MCYSYSLQSLLKISDLNFLDVEFEAGVRFILPSASHITSFLWRTVGNIQEVYVRHTIHLLLNLVIAVKIQKEEEFP